MAKKKMSPVLLAWMAGVIEMKGRMKHVANPLRKTAQLVLVVQSRHVVLVERLCEMTGVQMRVQGAKVMEGKSRKGCAEHCPEPHVHVGPELPETAVWAVTGAAAAVVLHNLLPYLCRQDGLPEWIDGVVTMLPKGGRGFTAVKNAVDRLAGLGWAVPEGLLPPPEDG